MSVLALLKKKQLEDKDWLWCIAGEEALLRDRALAHLRALCRKRQPALEESVLRGDAFSATELRNVLKNLSLFSPHRLIVIRSVESLRADDQKSLLALLEPRPRVGDPASGAVRR